MVHERRTCPMTWRRRGVVRFWREIDLVDDSDLVRRVGREGMIIEQQVVATGITVDAWFAIVAD